MEMMHPNNGSTVRLQMPCSHWLVLSLMIFGINHAQVNQFQRLLTIPEMGLLSSIGGKMRLHLLYNPTYAWHLGHVLLLRSEVAVLLKVIRWYEDNLIKHMEKIEAGCGPDELTKRYEQITQLTRAIQTAPEINSDQVDR